MIIKILASGSSGNSTFLKINNKNILIDCGISKKKIELALNKINIGIKELDYLFITHEHIDHIAGLVTLFKNSNFKLFLTAGTLNYLLNNSKYDIVTREKERIFVIARQKNAYLPFVLDDILITPLETFHDANEPVGYKFSYNDKNIIYLTDTGYIHHDVMKEIGGADCYILETNHEPEILMASDRPYNLKMRILSDHGHLSNSDSLYALAKLVNEKTKYVFYAHISQECNLREIIDITKMRIFNKLGIDCENIKFIHTLPTDLDEVEI